ncbi:hypothetical protein NHX12_026900, partial [Muraenolepis orangiensis]
MPGFDGSSGLAARQQRGREAESGEPPVVQVHQWRSARIHGGYHVQVEVDGKGDFTRRFSGGGGGGEPTTHTHTHTHTRHTPPTNQPTTPPKKQEDG